MKLSNSEETQLIIEQAHKAALEGIKTSLKEVEKQITQMIQQDAAIEKNYELLLSVPGIGHLTAGYIICCTNYMTFIQYAKKLETIKYLAQHKQPGSPQQLPKT